MSLALLLAALTVSQASLDQPGPYTTASARPYSFALGSGTTVSGDLYWPTNAASAAPIVVIGHGFARSAAQLTHWGEHLASWGFVAAVPSFPTPLFPDHALNASIMRELIALLRTTPGPITAQVDPARSAVIGHSAGGLSAFLAAAADPTISVLVGLDPVDAANAGLNAAPMITQPALVLAAAPAPCNLNGNASTLYGALTSPARWYLRVSGSSHCDGEDPSDLICATNCLGQDAARRALYRRYTTAHLLAYLDCQRLDHLPGGAQLTADLGASVVEDLRSTGAPSCAGADAGAQDAQPQDSLGLDAVPGDSGGAAADAAELPDAPAAEDAAPAADAAASPDAAAPLDAAAAPDAGRLDSGAANPDAAGGRDAAGSSDGNFVVEVRDSGCGCSAQEGRGSPWAWAALLVLLLRRRSMRE